MKFTRAITGLVVVGGILVLAHFFIPSNEPEAREEPLAEVTDISSNELAPPELLQVPLEETVELREEFMQEFQQVIGFDFYDLYDNWIDRIGANGLIDSIHVAYPNCHDRGHDLGRLIYHRIGDVGPALRTCDDSCYSGCMHGVMMGVFAIPDPEPHEHEGEVEPHAHVDINDIRDRASGICRTTATENYRVGDCAHGVGHAVMYVTNYDIDVALDTCEVFDTYAMQYYCATGAYMEYVGKFDIQDSLEKSGFYPCDAFDYPAACFRYKLANVVNRVYAFGAGTIENIAFDCEQLEGKFRLGCFHGLGNAHMPHIVRGEITLDTVCSFGNQDDQYVCVEGAIERMAKYHPQAAELACEQVAGWKYDVCRQSIENGLYDLEKSFDLYIR